MTTQKHLLIGPRRQFDAALAAELAAGWHVVPGTFACCSTEQVARDSAPGDYVSRNGTVFFQTHFVVLEKETEL